MGDGLWLMERLPARSPAPIHSTLNNKLLTLN